MKAILLPTQTLEWILNGMPNRQCTRQASSLSSKSDTNSLQEFSSHTISSQFRISRLAFTATRISRKRKRNPSRCNEILTEWKGFHQGNCAQKHQKIFSSPRNSQTHSFNVQNMRKFTRGMMRLFQNIQNYYVLKQNLT